MEKMDIMGDLKRDQLNTFNNTKKQSIALIQILDG